MQNELVMVEKKKAKAEFHKRAIFSQTLKNTMRWQENWNEMDDEKKQALEGIIDKISNILCGDPSCIKTWKSIMGYSKLVVDSLEANHPDLEIVSA